jgi:hypothetical protein
MLTRLLKRRTDEGIASEEGKGLFLTRAKDKRPQQFLLTIAGVEPKVGATHLALSLSAKARQHNISVALIISRESFEALRCYYHLSIEDDVSCASGEIGQKPGAEAHEREPRQFASLMGVSVMSGILPGDLEGYQLVVWDCGSLPHAKRRFNRGDLCCLVSGGQAWELLPLNNFLQALDYEDAFKTAVIIRDVGESDFNYIKQQMAGRLNCLKLLHRPDCFDLSFREDLTAILRLAGM